MTKSKIGIVYHQMTDMKANIKELTSSTAVLSMQCIESNALNVLFQKEVDEIYQLAELQGQLMILLEQKIKSINYLIEDNDSQRNIAAKV